VVALVGYALACPRSKKCVSERTPPHHIPTPAPTGMPPQSLNLTPIGCPLRSPWRDMHSLAHAISCQNHSLEKLVRLLYSISVRDRPAETNMRQSGVCMQSKHKKILVVDDEPDILEFLNSLCSRPTPAPSRWRGKPEPMIL
jgi:hypothetical protein